MKDEKSEMTNILLEAGTNELEIVEFKIGECYYGINVAKVQEIIRFPEALVDVPNSHNSVEGIMNLRGNVVPIMNLPKHLGKAPVVNQASSRIIVSEFNKFTVGFWVDSVSRIHRLSWNQVESPSGVFSSGETYVVAVVKMDDRIILLLDFEKITSDISPECGLQKAEVVDYKANSVSFDRKTKTILVAEDSTFIRDMILEYLKAAGYNTHSVTNGQEAWDIMSEFSGNSASKVEDKYQLLITDIEMPMMDGLHLIKNIKEDRNLKHVPCVVFSSMITDELCLKCKSVGADGEITKPEIENLVDLVDRLILQ